MTPSSSRMHGSVTFIGSVIIIELVLFINLFGQASPVNALSESREWFAWVVAAAGFISLALGIGYGFLKKQKYENLETERNELKSLAESREERIKDLKYQISDQHETWALKLANSMLVVKERENKVQNLEVSNEALVSQNLQMKAILKAQRIAGFWSGHEDRIHESQ